MYIHTLFLYLCVAIGIYNNAYALKMIPAEDVCVQQGLQPGTPEYDACVEQEQTRQAALIQAIMINEKAPEPETVKPAVEPYDQTVMEPAPETIAEPTRLPELPAPLEAGATEPVAQEEAALEPVVAEVKPIEAAVEQPVQTAPASLPVIALQQSIATKIKSQAATETAPNECSGQMTHHEFAAVDGCMATMEIDERGDAIEPTVFPRECAPSAEDIKRL